jgi:menaquinone-dependent protoporphyrinogen IX oxidase
MPVNQEGGEPRDEETELLEEIRGYITRLFRIFSLIRQAALTDLFAKALSRNRYKFTDQFNIAYIGEKYPKLATEDRAWLRRRLGRAIT